MKKLYDYFQRLYNKKIDASGLAVFRVLYAIILLGELFQLKYFKELIFDKIPFVLPADIDFDYGFHVWILSVVMIGLGLFTRTATIINYTLSLLFIGTIQTFEYHMFYAYMGINFLLMFMNISQVGSIDRLIQVWKYSNTRHTFNPSTKVSVLNYYAMLFLIVACVYFDSVFYKLASHNWTSGIGMWLPASLPQVTHMDTSWMLNSKWFVLFLGYCTLVFEAVYLFVFTRRWFRIPAIILGIGLHLGIVIEFPIPWFGLGLVGVYMLMVPVEFWRKLIDALQFKRSALTFYYDDECPLCLRVVVFLKHFDFFGALRFRSVQRITDEDTGIKDIDRDELLLNIYGKTKGAKILKGIDVYRYALLRMPLLFWIGALLYVPGIYQFGRRVYGWVAANRNTERCTEDNCGYIPPSFPTDLDAIKVTKVLTVKNIRVAIITGFFLILCIFQAAVTYDSLWANNLKQSTGVQNTWPIYYLDQVTKPIQAFSKIYLGITKHPVFMDHHFTGYNHVIAVEAELQDGRRIWLPIIDKEGHADSYVYSFNWVKWTFRVVGPNVNQTRIHEGIRDFSTFWAFRNGHDINTTVFHIYVKKVEVPTEWEFDFLKRQKSQPWMEVGTGKWVNKTFEMTLPEIEQL
jgi:predicted DCC family thiol-disulfide oxidoreductase YuxK